MTPNPGTNPGIQKYIPVVLISAIFLGFSLYNIPVPGVHPDEALNQYWFWNALKENNVWEGESHITLFNQKIPIMQGHYASPAYFHVPLLLTLGPGVLSMRLSTIIVGLLGIFLLYLLCEYWFNRKTAFIASLLTAVSPAYLMWNRNPLDARQMYMVVVFLLALYLFTLYVKKRSPFFLYGGAFLLGIGLWTKIPFIWFILGLFIIKFLFKIRFSRTESVEFTGSFVLGASPLIWANLTSGFQTVRLVLGSLTAPTWAGVKNPDFINNFLVRARQFIDCLRGFIYWEMSDSGLAHTFSFNELYPPIFFLAVVFGIIYLIKKRAVVPVVPRKPIIFLFIIFSVVFVGLCFTISTLGQHSLGILFPVPQVIVAVFAGYSLEKSRWQKVTRIVFLAALISLDTAVIFQYFRAYGKTGGHGVFSTVIYDLTDYLEKNEIRRPYSLDWGLSWTVPVITNWRVLPVELIYDYIGKSDFGEEIKHLSTEQGKMYFIAYSKNLSPASQRLQCYEKIKEVFKKRIIEERMFHNRVGAPCYRLLVLKGNG
ncbi:MAG: glycosyltransferase family 39 protein [Elusimicrobia bacterium]|nr:glycosyltransferase family 39 protein [Elusimicrobiota bacterium]